MSQGPHRFTQRDLTRAFRAAMAAGVTPRIAIDRDGTMILTPIAGPAEPQTVIGMAKDAADVVAERLR